MNDLISREETISYIENWKELNKYYHPYTKNTNIPIDEVIQVIKDVPSNNQTSVVEELEKITKEFTEQNIQVIVWGNGVVPLVNLRDCVKILDKHIAELKGENK